MTEKEATNLFSLRFIAVLLSLIGLHGLWAAIDILVTNYSSLVQKFYVNGVYETPYFFRILYSTAILILLLSIGTIGLASWNVLKKSLNRYGLFLLLVAHCLFLTLLIVFCLGNSPLSISVYATIGTTGSLLFFQSLLLGSLLLISFFFKFTEANDEREEI